MASLKSVLSSKESSILLIEDAVPTKRKSLALVRHIISTHADLGKARDKIVLIDGFNNPRNWNSDRKLDIGDGIIWNDIASPDTLLKILRNQLNGRESSEILVAIDSIEPVLEIHNITTVCALLKQILLLQAHVSLVTTVHLDLHQHDDVHVIKSLEYIADNIVQLIIPIPPIFMSFHLLHKRKGGKLARTEEHYKLGADGSLHFVEEKKSTTIAKEEKKVDPAANLTFNLTLTEEEKSAKDAVVLPYTHHLKKEESTATQGLIYLDDSDQDEEDPDDDLDI